MIAVRCFPIGQLQHAGLPTTWQELRNSFAFMNAPVTIPVIDEFAAATHAVNAWRGRCLHSFTRAEVIVTETLAVLAKTTADALSPHLVGQRFEMLAGVLRNRDHAAAAIDALETFRSHGDLRNMLCHGDSKVTIERSGRWQASFTMVTFRRGTVERRYLMIDPDEAAAVATMLMRDQQRLSAQLVRIVPPETYLGRDRIALRTGLLAG